MFTWKTVETTTVKIPRERRKIAAVDIGTDQISHIFSTCNEAARQILRAEYFAMPSEELIKECAGEIARAAAAYHKEVLGYYWKWV